MKSLDCWAFPLIPASPTIPMASPAARDESPQQSPAPRWEYPSQYLYPLSPVCLLVTRKVRKAVVLKIFGNKFFIFCGIFGNSRLLLSLYPGVEGVEDGGGPKDTCMGKLGRMIRRKPSIRSSVRPYPYQNPEKKGGKKQFLLFPRRITDTINP